MSLRNFFFNLLHYIPNLLYHKLHQNYHKPNLVSCIAITEIVWQSYRFLPDWNQIANLIGRIREDNPKIASASGLQSDCTPFTLPPTVHPLVGNFPDSHIFRIGSKVFTTYGTEPFEIIRNLGDFYMIGLQCSGWSRLKFTRDKMIKVQLPIPKILESGARFTIYHRNRTTHYGTYPV